MDYKLALSRCGKIHLVFHMSFLKKASISNYRFKTIPPKLDEDSSIWMEHDAILENMSVVFTNALSKKYWSNGSIHKQKMLHGSDRDFVLI